MYKCVKITFILCENFITNIIPHINDNDMEVLSEFFNKYYNLNHTYKIYITISFI